MSIIALQGLMNQLYHTQFMAEGPQLDDFMRHLQACLEEASQIADQIERDERILQLEIAIQEAIIFKNRFTELVSHGIDPLVLVKANSTDETPPPATKSQALTLGFQFAKNVAQA